MGKCRRHSLQRGKALSPAAPPPARARGLPARDEVLAQGAQELPRPVLGRGALLALEPRHGLPDEELRLARELSQRGLHLNQRALDLVP